MIEIWVAIQVKAGYFARALDRRLIVTSVRARLPPRGHPGREHVVHGRARAREQGRERRRGLRAACVPRSRTPRRPPPPTPPSRPRRRERRRADPPRRRRKPPRSTRPSTAASDSAGSPSRRSISPRTRTSCGTTSGGARRPDAAPARGCVVVFFLPSSPERVRRCWTRRGRPPDPAAPPFPPRPPRDSPRSYECKLCLTVHGNEGNYLAHTQGRRHQQIWPGARRATPPSARRIRAALATARRSARFEPRGRNPRGSGAPGTASRSSSTARAAAARSCSRWTSPRSRRARSRGTGS